MGTLFSVAEDVRISAQINDQWRNSMHLLFHKFKGDKTCTEGTSGNSKVAFVLSNSFPSVPETSTAKFTRSNGPYTDKQNHKNYRIQHAKRYRGRFKSVATILIWVAKRSPEKLSPFLIVISWFIGFLVSDAINFPSFWHIVVKIPSNIVTLTVQVFSKTTIEFSCRQKKMVWKPIDCLIQ